MPVNCRPVHQSSPHFIFCHQVVVFAAVEQVDDFALCVALKPPVKHVDAQPEQNKLLRSKLRGIPRPPVNKPERQIDSCTDGLRGFGQLMLPEFLCCAAH